MKCRIIDNNRDRREGIDMHPWAWLLLAETDLLWSIIGCRAISYLGSRHHPVTHHR